MVSATGVSMSCVALPPSDQPLKTYDWPLSTWGEVTPRVRVMPSTLLTVSGADVVTAFSAALASMNNTGPGLAQVGPASTYAVLNDFQVWVCSFAMLLGRLELFTLLVVLTPAFWRK